MENSELLTSHRTENVTYYKGTFRGIRIAVQQMITQIIIIPWQPGQADESITIKVSEPVTRYGFVICGCDLTFTSFTTAITRTHDTPHSGFYVLLYCVVLLLMMMTNDRIVEEGNITADPGRRTTVTGTRIWWLFRSARVDDEVRDDTKLKCGTTWATKVVLLQN